MATIRPNAETPVTSVLPGDIFLIDGSTGVRSLAATSVPMVNGNTTTAGTGVLTIAAAKTLTAHNSLTLAGTDGTTQTFPSTSATIARTDAGQTFTGTNAFGVLTATSINGNTISAGTGVLTLAAGKTLTASNSLTLAGTDATTFTFPSASDTVVTLAAAQTLTNKTHSGGTLSGTFSGTPTLSGANFITRANLAQVVASSLSGNPTGTLADESAVTLGSTLNFSGTTLNATTATASQLGAVKPDGSTITISGGVLTAVGGAASNITPGTTTVTGGAALGYLYSNGTTLGNAVPASLQASVALPTATVSNPGAMMGLGASFHLTPAFSGRISLTICGYLSAAAAVEPSLQIYYGTGTAPANSASATGTSIGQPQLALLSSTALPPFSKTVVITGLTVGTAYWFDLKLNSNNGTSVAVNNVDCAAFEF
jgi:hypothetical protein